MIDNMLTDEEVFGILTASKLRSLHERKKDLSAREVNKIIAWAQEAKLQSALFDLAAAGLIGVLWPKGAEEPDFYAVPEPRRKRS